MYSSPVPSKSESITRLRRQLKQLEGVPSSRNDRSGAFERWHRPTRVAIDHTFGEESKHSKEFAAINYYPLITTQNTTDEDRERSYRHGLERAKLLLESLVDEIEEYWPEDAAGSVEMINREYDVCLSFAGEDRAYVEAVAEALRSSGVRPFYDLYEEVRLWGKDLYQHLDDVYRNSAQFCVLFISKAYATKLWTKHELRSAQARAFAEHQEYILPARFDDTSLPGVPATVAYVNLRHKSPSEFASLIVQKLRAATHADPANEANRATRIDVSSVAPAPSAPPELKPHVMPIRPWFTTVRVADRGTLDEDESGPLKALVAPFRNDPTPDRPHVADATRLSAAVWFEAMSDFRVTGYWLGSTSPFISIGVGDQWLLVLAVVAPKLASLPADGRRGDIGAVELKHFWTARTNVTKTTAVVSIVSDGILLGQHRYELVIAPFPGISLLSG
jgi:hypothetical protein